MLARILLAGLAGGLVAFALATAGHVTLGLGDAGKSNVPEEYAFIDSIKYYRFQPGLYVFPGLPSNSSAADRLALNERYKAGPSGLLLIGPTGQDIVGPKQWGLQAATHILAALIGAWIVSLLASDVGFARRWFVVVSIGISGWFALNASYGIAHRFPWEFLQGGLLSVLIEWSAAGLVIAALVRQPSTRIQQAETALSTV